MSWDVTVQRFSRVYDSIEEIPDSERCVPLGNRKELHRAISKFFPGTDWSDPAWGVFDSSAGSIEFNCGDEEPSTGFMMHIRASEEVVSQIIAMCLSEKWQALDCSSGEFLEKSADPIDGIQTWTSFRNRVVGDV